MAKANAITKFYNQALLANKRKHENQRKMRTNESTSKITAVPKFLS